VSLDRQSAKRLVAMLAENKFGVVDQMQKRRSRGPRHCRAMSPFESDRHPREVAQK
jgi:hypothetical protein